MIRVCEPTIGEKEKEYVSKAVEENQISSTTHWVKDFEEAFAEYCGTDYAVAVNSGGSALELVLMALGVGEGDEVIVPTFTMVATANAVERVGAKPVFVDCDETGNINAENIHKHLTPNTKAIIPVHIYGQPCDMDEVNEVARDYGLHVIEDAAEAHGAIYKGDMTGNLGDAGCFSFYANKIITTGEGGMITTNDPELKYELDHLRIYYFDDRKHFWHKKVAPSWRMTALQAALGLAQLERIDELILGRQQNEAWYDEYMGDLFSNGSLRRLEQKDDRSPVCWMYGVLTEHRDALMEHLKEEGIETRTFFFPMHWQPIYMSDNSLPCADRLGNEGLYLPSSSHLTEEQVASVSSAAIDFFDGIL